MPDRTLPTPPTGPPGAAATTGPRGLRVLLVDDEAPALSELSYLLRRDDRIGQIRTASSGADALRALDAAPVDVVFCDIKMPGLDGMDLARVLAARTDAGDRDAPAELSEDETIPVDLGGVTTFVQRSQVRYAQAHGDYARLHTAESSHLVRISLTTLEERWGPAGFVRIHRSTLVSLAHVRELRMDDGHCTVRLDDVELVVSRRHTRDLRERLLHRGRPA